MGNFGSLVGQFIHILTVATGIVNSDGADSVGIDINLIEYQFIIRVVLDLDTGVAVGNAQGSIACT